MSPVPRSAASLAIGVLLAGATTVVPVAHASGPAAASRATTSTDAQLREGAKLLRQVMTAPNPAKAAQALPARERQILEAYVTPVAETVQTRVSAASTPAFPADGCWQRTESRAAKAVAGNVLYRYGQTTRVCKKNGAWTSAKVIDKWSKAITPGWDEGPISVRVHAQWGWARGVTGHKFDFIWKIGQHPTNYLNMTASVGGWTVTASPDLY